MRKARAAIETYTTSETFGGIQWCLSLLIFHVEFCAMCREELHDIIEGTGVVVTGGTIVRGTAKIEGGETHAVKKGDVILVPSGSAHWYKEVTTPITYLEVRFVAPK